MKFHQKSQKFDENQKKKIFIEKKKQKYEQIDIKIQQ